MMSKSYAIFDLDGTLIDSMPFWENLGKEYLATKGIVGDFDQLFEEIETMTLTESAIRFVEYFSLKETPEIAMREMDRLMEHHYREDVPLKKKVLNYLMLLKQRHVHMCIASVTSEELIRRCIKRLGILDYFDFLLSCESMKTSKREPKIYLEAAKRFQAEPEQIMVFEDAFYAIDTAKKAGFYCIAVEDRGSASDRDKIIEIADEVICFD